MRIPESSFDAADIEMCRAHYLAVEQDHYGRMLVGTVDATGNAYRAACDDFESVTLDQAQSDSYWQWQHEVHGGHGSPAPQSDDDAREQLAVELLETDGGEGHKYLARLRGGCSCCVSPPCSACTDPLTGDEIDRIIDKFGPAQGDAYVSAKQPEPAADVWHSEALSVARVYETRRFNYETRNFNAKGMRWYDGREWHLGPEITLTKWPASMESVAS